MADIYLFVEKGTFCSNSGVGEIMAAITFNRLKKYFNVKFLMNNKYISCKLDNLYYIIIICRNSTENRQKMQH